jgi:Lar family restriction alleviation protein
MQDDIEARLLPCPFCGGEAELHHDKGATGEVYAWVSCNQCDAMSLCCDIRSMQMEEPHPIDAWNTRSDSDTIAALLAEVDRMREALHDAICRPFGVVPASTEEFYIVALADQAEARRVALGEQP